MRWAAGLHLQTMAWKWFELGNISLYLCPPNPHSLKQPSQAPRDMCAGKAASCDAGRHGECGHTCGRAVRVSVGECACTCVHLDACIRGHPSRLQGQGWVGMRSCGHTCGWAVRAGVGECACACAHLDACIRGHPSWLQGQGWAPRDSSPCSPLC